jgi:hypothetical protein
MRRWLLGSEKGASCRGPTGPMAGGSGDVGGWEEKSGREGKEGGGGAGPMAGGSVEAGTMAELREAAVTVTGGIIGDYGKLQRGSGDKG